MIYSYAPKIPERPSAEGFYCPARARAPTREAQRDFPVPRAKFRLRSTCSARTAWEFAKLPFCCAKPRFLRPAASHPHHRTGPEKAPLKTPVSERSERIGVFPVPPGHGPRRGSCRGDKKGCHLRVTAFSYVCGRWSLENTPPAFAQEEGRIQAFSGRWRLNSPGTPDGAGRPCRRGG